MFTVSLDKINKLENKQIEKTMQFRIKVAHSLSALKRVGTMFLGYLTLVTLRP